MVSHSIGFKNRGLDQIVYLNNSHHCILLLLYGINVIVFTMYNSGSVQSLSYNASQEPKEF